VSEEIKNPCSRRRRLKGFFFGLQLKEERERSEQSPSATSQKPCCDSNRALLFLDRQMLAFVRDRNNKDQNERSELKAFSLLSTH